MKYRELNGRHYVVSQIRRHWNMNQTDKNVGKRIRNATNEKPLEKNQRMRNVTDEDALGKEWN